MTRCSVALCTYNGARHLPDQLESIVSQTRRPDELVVSDDGSGDGTLDILRRFAAQAPFPVRLQHNAQTAGVTKNFENAIRLCEGDWIALSDQDDVWRPTKLKVLEASLDGADQPGVVFTDAEVVDEELRPLGYTLWDAMGFDRGRRRAARKGRLLDVLLWRNVVTGATMAFRSGLRARILPLPGVWLHDAWIAVIGSVTDRAAMVEEPTIQYRQHAAAQIGADKPSLRRGVARAMTTPASDLVRQLRQWEAARERIVALGGSGSTDAAVRIGRKMAHVAARARMPGPTWRRIPAVAAELVTLNYHRYSSGWRSAARDLVQPAGQRGAIANDSV